MRLSLPLIAVSAGAMIVLSPLSTSASQAAPSAAKLRDSVASRQDPASASSINLWNERHTDRNNTAEASAIAFLGTLKLDHAIAPENSLDGDAIDTIGQANPEAAPENPESNDSDESDDSNIESEADSDPAAENVDSTDSVENEDEIDAELEDERESEPVDPAIDPQEDVSEEAESSSEATAGEEAEPVELNPQVSPVETPEYLNPHPNPLTYPTLPEEVELAGTQPITLEEAIELARRNNSDLQNAYLELEQSRAALRESQAANLPSLDASTNLTRRDTDSAAPVPTDLAGNEIEQDTISTNLDASLQLSYDIYTSGRRSSLIEAAELRVRLQELQIEAVSEELRLAVTENYYDLQETDELVRIARQSLEESLQSLRDAQALERAGVGTRFDVLQAEVDVANSRQDLIQSLSDQEVSRRALVQQLNLSQTVDVSAADPVEVADLWELPLEETIVLAFENRAELEQQLLQRDVSEQLRQVALSALGPQVAAFASYSMNDLLDETDSESDTESYAIGLRASMQLYDGGAARAAARQEELNIAIAETAFESTRNDIRFQVEQSYSSLEASFENIQTASLAVETATEALRLARLRFQAGVGTQTDVLEAQTDLTQAEVNRLQAILGYNRSLARLRRAVSNLDGDLSDRP